MHLHQHEGPASREREEVSGSLRLALLITSAVMVLELVGGLYSNSLALLADAGHMFTDVAALGLSFFAIWFAARPATPRKTYGFYRVEILAALVNGVLLVVLALFIFHEAYERLRTPPPVDGGLMLLVASGGLAANLASAYLLFRKQAHSLNVRGAFFHVVSDALGSVGAIVASLLIMFFGWNSADAVISAIVALLILSSSWVLIRDAVDVLLESAPAHINLKSLKDHIVGVEGVRSVHDLHVWTLTSGLVAMSCHVVVREPRAEGHVLAEVSRLAHDRFRIDHTTIQIERDDTGDREFDACGCHFGAS